ncbi:MAG: hypothetical protein J0L80_12980 [Chitinophagales bacterium]|nr:hypothetical protein [Chitinophagales bacterium]
MIPKLILTGITFCTAFLFILPEQKASWHLISKTHSREAIAEEIADYVNEISHNKKVILLVPEEQCLLRNGINNFPDDEMLSHSSIQVVHPDDDSLQYCTHGIWIINEKVLIGRIQKKYQADSLVKDYVALNKTD